MTNDLTRTHLLIYTLNSIIDLGELPDRDKIAGILKIKKTTLDKNLREIKQKNLIISNKNEIERIVSFQITSSGIVLLDQINAIISETVLDPESSGLSRKVSLQTVLDHLKDPYEKLGFMERFLFGKQKDATFILETIKDQRPDSRISKYIQEVLSINGDSDIETLEGVLKSSSIYHSVSSYKNIDGIFSGSNVDQLIIEAEILRRKGSEEEAICIYNGLLKRSTCLESNRWILCLTGLIQCIAYMNREVEGIELLEKMRISITNPVEKGFLNKVKADILQDLERFEEASDLYKSCLGVFQESDHPLIRVTILNNLGVQYFRNGKVKIATDLWEEALKISSRIDLPYLVSIISINLADVYALDKRFYKAEELLRNAGKILESSGDLEGLSGVDFNRSLLYVEKEEKEKALKYYNKAMSFPLTYKRKREERRKVFEGRMRAKGFL